MVLFSPRPTEARARARALIDVALDPTQKRAAHRVPGGAMLVLGEAGHGKTTVALHRLAFLYASSSNRYRAVVVVPNEGLQRLLQQLVTRLGADVEVMTYDRWAVQQARRAFGDIPRRESKTASVAVSSIKRDPAIRPILHELALAPPGRIDDDADAPPPKTKATAHRGDLQHLFGDSALMNRVVRSSAQGLPAHAVTEVIEHTHVQFTQRAETMARHVDADRLVTIDNRSIDDGTPSEDAWSIDTEDYAIMFELDRLRAQRLRVKPVRPRQFDCIILDEAQEFAPLELALIGRSLKPSGTLVVAGDADQQIEPSACFEGWPQTMRELGATSYETVVLEAGYRCPTNVVAFARSVRDGKNPKGSGVPMLPFESEERMIEWLRDEGQSIEEHDPTATTCIICHTPFLAKRIAAGLRGVVPCRLVLDGDFIFHRGVDITTVDQVKGLEFDYVILADATSGQYPDLPRCRRAMYMAATRTRHQLAVAWVGEPSPLLAQ